MAEIIDGKALSEKLKAEIAERTEKLALKGHRTGLAVILVGENPASKIYVKNKIAACERTGIKSFSYTFPETAEESEVAELICALNEDDNVDGILVQLPLPRHMDERRLLEMISPDKDADGFHTQNAGRLFLGEECSAACTPSGIIELIKSTGVSIEGKHAVIIGRSNIVGKPLAMLLLQNNATVTICHSKTKNIKEISKTADILAVAIGSAEFVTADFVKPGAVVIDVGMNRTENGLKGDVKFDEVSKTAGYITPVPGGVGPMTIAMLMKNTLAAAKSCR